jgi:lysophospholipid acyltransferase (LPLAT)-like uncharacterized protein
VKKLIKTIEAILGKWLLLFLHRTNRWSVEGEEYYQELVDNGESFIFACWHGVMLAPFVWCADRGFHALAGLHKDAELIAKIGALLGWNMLRGSSTEGGKVVYQEIVSLLKIPGKVFALTPDGPKGPAKIPKPGAIRAAQKTGVKVIPVAAQSSRRWEFTNWDTYYVTKPFGRIALIFGEPLVLAPDEDFEICSQRLKTALDTVEANANERIDGKQNDTD